MAISMHATKWRSSEPKVLYCDGMFIISCGKQVILKKNQGSPWLLKYFEISL